MFDKLFKVAILCLLASLIVGVWNMGNNGRYAIPTTGAYSLLDTRTGTLYDMSKGALKDFDGSISFEEHPQTGEIAIHYGWKRR